MLIIDGDYPMAYGGVDLDRDLTLPIDQVRGATDRRTLSAGWPDSETMASLPEMRKGGVAAALVKVAGRIRRPNSPIWGYRTGHGAYAAAQAHLAYYEVLASEGEARVLATSGDFAAHMREWSDAEDYSALPVGFIVGMEGADPILWPEQVHEWWEKGLRVISLSHYGVSTYSHGTGTGTEGGLFPPAEALLRGCLKTDLSCSWREDCRASKVAFHEQAELSKRPERPTMAATRTTATSSQTGRPTNQVPASGGDERYSLCVAYRVRVADASSRPASLAHHIPLLSHLAARWDLGEDS